MTRKDSELKTKKDQVVDWLRDTILAGELSPGDRLLQEDLAEKFDVSPTPIREAIQQLVAEGILVHSAYKGVQVAEVRMEDVREVYLIRCELEKLATLVAVPNLTIARIKQMRELQTQIEAHIAAQDLLPLRKFNQEFHMLIYQAAAMPMLYAMIRTLWTRFPWDTLHVLPNRAAVSAAEHRQVLEAIAAGDEQLAAEHMYHHVRSSAESLEIYLNTQG